MALMHQVLSRGELHIDALRLGHYADASAYFVGLRYGIETGDASSAAGRNHQRAQNSEKRCLAAAVRTQESEGRSGVDIKGNGIESHAFAITVRDSIDFDSAVRSHLQLIFG